MLFGYWYTMIQTRNRGRTAENQLQTVRKGGKMRLFELTRRSAAAVAIGALALAASASASVADPLAHLNGSWSGGGQFRLDNGNSESLRCNANYSPRRESLGLSLRCASASGKIELRASLVSRGNRVSGTWEERSYNVAGNVSGMGAGNSLRLGINGGGLSGSMVVTTTGRTQSISVRTDGAALRGINIRLNRN